MRLEQLQYFVDVAGTGSINSTAQNVFATQQSINVALKRLEEEVGCKLLERSTSGVILTDQGQLFLAYALETIEGYGTVLKQMQTMNDENCTFEEEGQLNIIMASVLCDVIFPEILHGFHQKHPKVKLKITKIASETLLEQFGEGAYDLGFLTTNEGYAQGILEELGEDLESQELLEDRLMVCLKANSLFADKKKLTHQEFGQLPYSIYSTIPAKLFKEKSYNNAIHISDDAEFHKKLISQNLCATLMPEFAYINLFKGKKFIALPIENTLPIKHIAIQKKVSVNKLNDDFIKAVRQYIQKRL